MLIFAERLDDSVNCDKFTGQPIGPCNDEGSVKEVSSGTSTRSEQLERIEAMSVTLPILHHIFCIVLLKSTRRVQISTKAPPTECQ